MKQDLPMVAIQEVSRRTTRWTVSASKIRQMCNDGELPHFRLDESGAYHINEYRISGEVVLRYEQGLSQENGKSE